EELDFDSPSESHFVCGINFHGSHLEDVSVGAEVPRALVRHNVFRHLERGIWVEGCYFGSGYTTASPYGQLGIQDNEFTGCKDAIILSGSIIRVQVVGNKLLWATRLGIQLENLLAGSRDILIANHSLLESVGAFRLWATAPKGRHIRIYQNLLLGHGARGSVFWDRKGKWAGPAAGPGSGAAVTAKWNLHHNWRELKSRKANSPGLIPPSDRDNVRQPIEVLSR